MKIRVSWVGQLTTADLKMPSNEVEHQYKKRTYSVEHWSIAKLDGLALNDSCLSLSFYTEANLKGFKFQWMKQNIY